LKFLKYFIFFDSFFLSLPFFPLSLSFYEVACHRFASSPRFAALRFARAFSLRRVFPASSRSFCVASLRFAPLLFLSLATHTGVALGLDSASSRLRLGLERPRLVPFVRWAFSPIQRRSLGKDVSPAGAGGGAIPQVGGFSPCVRVRLHGDGPGAMFRYHHCFGSGHIVPLLLHHVFTGRRYVLHSTAIATPVETAGDIVRLSFVLGEILQP